MLVQYDSIDEISDQARLDEDSDLDSDSALDKTYVPRSRAKPHTTSPRPDYESEPDEGLRTPRVSQRRAQRRGNFSPRNSETSPPTTAIYEEQPRTRTPTSASQRSTTDKIAVDLRTNVSSWGSPASRGRADSRSGVVPSNSRQGTPGQMDLDERPQRETTGPKRKSSITHGDPQVTQETDAMVIDGLEGSATHKRPRHHASESKRMTNVLVEHRLAQHRGKQLASLRERHTKLAEKAQEQEQAVNEQSKAAVTLRKKLDNAKKRISSDQDKIKGLKLQVYQLQAQIKTEGEPTESSTKPDPSINKLNSRLEARRAEIEGLRAVIARNEEEIAKLNTELEEERASTAEITEIENLVKEMESRKRLEDAIHALELERNELRNQIQKERGRYSADLRHLQSDLKSAQEKEAELRQKVVHYRTGREQKKKEEEAVLRELVCVRQELKNVRQEREKDLESGRAKEAELMAEVERYRKAYKGKAKEFDDFNHSVDEADKETELRNELETLKIVHTRAIIEKSNELTAMHQKYLRRSRRIEEQDTEAHRHDSGEEQGEPVPAWSLLKQGTRSAPSTSNGKSKPTVLPSKRTIAGAPDTRKASPLLRQSDGTSSTAPPQAGPSTALPHHTDLREARKRRDDELARQRKQADASARRRR